MNYLLYPTVVHLLDCESPHPIRANRGHLVKCWDELCQQYSEEIDCRNANHVILGFFSLGNFQLPIIVLLLAANRFVLLDQRQLNFRFSLSLTDGILFC